MDFCRFLDATAFAVDCVTSKLGDSGMTNKICVRPTRTARHMGGISLLEVMLFVFVVGATLTHL